MSKCALINGLLLTAPAYALQPLQSFLESASKHNYDDRESAARVEQRDGEAMQTWGKLLPVLSAVGSYTRNQQAVELTLPSSDGSSRTVTISALDQVDATLSASLTLIDVQTWLRSASSLTSAESQRHRLQETKLETERQVARAYYVLLAAEAVVASTEKALSVQREALILTRERKEAGLAGELDLRRSNAEMELARQSVADARYSLSAARRTLHTLSRLDPQPSQAAPSLDVIASVASETTINPPAVLAAQGEARAAQLRTSAVWTQLLPTLSVQANERVTNAPSFGPNPFWNVALTARWTIDAAQFGSLRAERAAAEQANIRAERAAQAARDQVEDARSLVENNLIRASAARARFDEAKLAASLAKDRYQEGKSTQLEVIQAERDLMDADVSRIRAQADLLYAHALVGLSEGHSLLERSADGSRP